MLSSLNILPEFYESFLSIKKLTNTNFLKMCRLETFSQVQCLYYIQNKNSAVPNLLSDTRIKEQKIESIIFIL